MRGLKKGMFEVIKSPIHTINWKVTSHYTEKYLKYQNCVLQLWQIRTRLLCNSELIPLKAKGD